MPHDFLPEYFALSLKRTLDQRISRRPSPSRACCVISVHRVTHSAGTRIRVQCKKSLLSQGGRKMSFRPNLNRSLLFALAAFSLAVVSASDAAAGYPDRIVKIVVPFAPGGGTDVVARTLAQEMTKDLGANVII